MSKKKLLLIISVVVVVVALAVISLTMDTTKTTDVQAEVAKQIELVEKVSASGRIQPQTKVNITSEVNGEIIDLRTREGDNVKTGQLLVVLDTVQLRSDVDQAQYAVSEIRARLEGSKVELAQAEEEHKRQERLFNEKLTSETSYTNARYAFMNAKAATEAMEAQANQFQSRYEKQKDYLNKAKIVAPMPGIITFLDCEVGEIAAAQTAFTQGKTLMTISNLDVFEVEVEVDETEINKIELNQIVDIEVDAYADSVFPGEVVEIGNTAIVSGLGTQDQSTNFKVKVIFKEPNVKIRPGMSATVDIITNRKAEALAIPYSAVVMRSFDLDSLEKARESHVSESSSVVSEAHAAEGEMDTVAKSTDGEKKELKGVFLIEDGVAKFVEIQTGIADQKNIEVLSGLAASDSVIAGPYRVLRTIKDGEAVKISSPAGEKKE